MLSWLDRLRKEWHVIEGAPFSFFIACVVMSLASFFFTRFGYKEKLDDAHELIEHWKGDADYWKDMASHVTYGQNGLPEPANSTTDPKKTAPTVPMKSAPSKPASKNPLPNHALISTQVPTLPVPQPTVSAPNGIAIGGNNSGTNTVTNIGALPRTLTEDQAATIRATIGAPSPDFDGIRCLISDEESCRFADQIRKVFLSAGWPHSTPNDWKREGYGMSIPPGVMVAVNPADASAPPESAYDVFGAFKRAGITVHVFKTTDCPRGRFYVLTSSS
jgi:hypothetical protein